MLLKSWLLSTFAGIGSLGEATSTPVQERGLSKRYPTGVVTELVGVTSSVYCTDPNRYWVNTSIASGNYALVNSAEWAEYNIDGGLNCGYELVVYNLDESNNTYTSQLYIVDMFEGTTGLLLGPTAWSRISYGAESFNGEWLRVG
ncbi:hypothetical protein DL93DRAFT_2156132 [Clavulina sp. PMI_390]|nr:hypothetical protein DL93DRAFT_2156132 [Clavulina sp. PMI_390]